MIAILFPIWLVFVALPSLFDKFESAFRHLRIGARKTNSSQRLWALFTLFFVSLFPQFSTARGQSTDRQLVEDAAADAQGISSTNPKGRTDCTLMFGARANS